ncbi:MAG: 3-oxoacyl-ACP synthase III [Pseudomonadales bacterium]|nr:3-oxoacyl-ACP synthase III [Pseudomonadales bacterium]
MKYTRVFIDDISYELAPREISSDWLEQRLSPVYQSLRIPKGQLKIFTGIETRRWWPDGFRYSDGAIMAAKKSLAKTGMKMQDIGAVIYTSVSRESYEPATACRVAFELGANSDTVIHDISNACLGVLNGIVDIANRIELGQIRAGMVVSCESAEGIVETIMQDLLNNPTMKGYSDALATLTLGSGAIALIITDGSFNQASGHKLLTVSSRSSAEDYDVCRCWMEEDSPGLYRAKMYTDAVTMLKRGLILGLETWHQFLQASGWNKDDIDKLICHQVGSVNRRQVLKILGIAEEKDFITYPSLGNVGTVSLPITAAMAYEQGELVKGDKVAFMGIGSGLNCSIMAVEW